MAFNEAAFVAAQFHPREEPVKVPALADFFGSEDEPVWIVRGQTASEMANAAEASTNNKTLSSLIEAIGENKTKVEELRSVLGLSDDVPLEVIKRLNQLTTCSVEPKIDHMTAVKLAETFPVEFFILTNEIVKLTGLGMENSVKKPKASGVI